MKNQIFGAIFLSVAAAAIGSGSAVANSEFIQGKFTEIDPAGEPIHERSICSFITGPRADLARGEFLLTIGDHHSPGKPEVRLTGTYTAEPEDSAGDQEFILHTDQVAAERHVQTVLRNQLADTAAVFELQDLDAHVRQVPRGRLLCTISVTGRLA